MNKFSKKTVALVLVVTMLLAFAPSLSFADEPADPAMILKTDSDYHKKGDEFSMEVWVYNSTFNVAGFCLRYDPEVISPVDKGNFYNSVTFDEYITGDGVFEPATAKIENDLIKAVFYVSPLAEDKPAYPGTENKESREAVVGSEGYCLAVIKFVSLEDGCVSAGFTTSANDADFDSRSVILNIKGSTPGDVKTSISYSLTPAADAEAFAEMVSAIGEVTIDSEEAINLALDTYENLSSQAKELAGDAKKELDEMKALLDAIIAEMGDEEIAQKVITDLRALDETSSDDLQKLEAEITAVTAAYEALTENQKNLVNEAVDAEKIISDAQARADKAKEAAVAEEIKAAIGEFPAAEDITLDDAKIINDTKAAYDSLSEEGQALIGEALVKILEEAAARVKELEAAAYIIGDVNGDKKVNASDATQILRYVNNKSSILNDVETGSALFSAADVDKNGKISAADATQILRYANEKSSVFDLY